jgi:hypothetical protein
MRLLLFLVSAFVSLGSVFAQATFQEVSQQAGISHYQKSELHLGGGVAVFDLDNDGWEDIYLTGGENRDKLYRNNGGGTFTEIGIIAGFGLTAAVTTLGVVTGDIDNDGFRDILVLTDLGFENMLYRNNGDGTFTRLVTALGVSTPERSVSATMGDANNDGLLDIYITNYVRETGIIFNENNHVAGFSHTCDADRLFINNGDLTFTESSVAYGIDQQGCGLAAAFTDYDDDGIMDIMVVNDFGQWVIPNALYRNLHPAAAFEDVSEEVGMDGGFYGMGVAIGDYDRDGDLDYYMTNIGRNYLFRNDGTHFTEVAGEAAVLNDSVNGLNTTGWSTFFFDHDNDGLLDLFVANGEIPAAHFIANSLEDPDKLYRNNGDGTFSDVTTTAGLGSTQRSRGAAFGDFNNDGKLDIVVHTVKYNEPGEVRAQLYMNTTDNGNNFVRVQVVGTTSNRDGFGSHVRAVVNGQSQMAEVDGGSGHASHNSTIVHFGIGTATTVDSIIVRFPSGVVMSLADVGANQTVTIIEDMVTSDGVLPADGFTVERIGVRDFVIRSNGDSADAKVYDMSGRLIAHSTCNNGAYRIPEGLSGIYILEILVADNIFHERIMLPSR